MFFYVIITHVEIAQKFRKKGLNINSKKLSNIFRNPFYCGLIVNNLIPGEVIQGKHPALISKELFIKIHGLLNTTKQKYSLDDENLPLKTFLKSTACGTPYTGYIVKKKNLYYYKNRRIGSKENRSAKKLHAEFLKVLESFSLEDPKYKAPLKEIIYDTFMKLNQESLKETQLLKKEIAELEIKLERIEERFVFEEINKAQYDKLHTKIKQEKTQKEKNLANSKFDASNLEKSINLALEHALNLPLLWSSGDIQTKKTIQYMVFPEGIQYDFENKQIRTPRVNSIFSAIARTSKFLMENKNENHLEKFDDSRLVSPEGFEPSTASLEGRCSIHTIALYTNTCPLNNF